MEKNHHNTQQPCDFFNVFSENQPLNEENYITYKGLQKSSSSSANILVSTELSLSSIIAPSFTKTRTTSQHTHQYFSIRKTKPSKPSFNYSNNHKTNYISQCSASSGGCSTALKLYDDPWKIKKVLTASDLGGLNRLLLSSEDSMEDLLRNNNTDHNNNNNNNGNDERLLIVGRQVRVWDVDTKSMHLLILKRWPSFKNYVMIGYWKQDFVKRRALKKGDDIGLQWDPYNFCFNFSVLKRSLQ